MGKKLCSLKDGHLKSFGCGCWVEMLNNGFLQTHTPPDNVSYYDFGEIVFFCMTKLR